VVRGFVALGRLQAGRNNEALASILNSVELTGGGKTVGLSLTVPAEAFDMLTPRVGSPRQAGAGL
jgi:hypothetical protein